jgi:hypothetical protein
MLMPFFRKLGYASATSWLLVLSTRTTLPGALTRFLDVESQIRER